MTEGRQLKLEPCVYCSTCPARSICDEGATEHGCDNEYSAALRARDVLHPRHPKLTELLASSGGLDIELRRTDIRQQPDLPPYVPRVQLQAGLLKPDWPALALPLDRVATNRRIYTSRESRELLGVQSDTKLIVTGFHHDEVLELRWARLDLLARALADAAYDLITVPNFSLWKGDTRLEHRFNIARTIRFFEALTSYGVATRPHVSFLFNRDVDDWIAELRKWPTVRTFSLDFATFKTDADWKENLVRVKRLFGGVGRDYEVLVNGVAKAERIRELGQIMDNFTLVNEHAYQLAMSRHVTRDQLDASKRVERSDLGREAIFRAEVERTAADVRLAMLKHSTGDPSPEQLSTCLERAIPYDGCSPTSIPNRANISRLTKHGGAPAHLIP